MSQTVVSNHLPTGNAATPEAVELRQVSPVRYALPTEYVWHPFDVLRGKGTSYVAVEPREYVMLPDDAGPVLAFFLRQTDVTGRPYRLYVRHRGPRFEVIQ